MLKIADHLIQVCENTGILTRASHPVNIRLYKNNKKYRNVIIDIICYMDEHLRTVFCDYEPKGVAACTLGFPLQIIGYKETYTQNQFLINPKILRASKFTTTTKSNSGVINLDQPVDVERYNFIDITYYDISGKLVKKNNITKSHNGFTIQHEVNQMMGIPLLNSKN